MTRKYSLRALSFTLGVSALAALAIGTAGCPKKPPKTTPTETPEESPSPTPTPDDNALMHGAATPEPTPMATCEGLAPVHFALDSSAIEGDNLAAAKAFADCLLSNSDAHATIEGHADERGSTQYNLALGDRRAHAVEQYLVNAGVAKSRLDTVSYGKERPVAKGHDESAWAQNRRAEIKVHK